MFEQSEGQNFSLKYDQEDQERNNGVPFFFFCHFVFRAAPAAYGGSQARSLIGAIATGLHQSHSNTRSKPHLQPIPQLMATTLDP